MYSVWHANDQPHTQARFQKNIHFIVHMRCVYIYLITIEYSYTVLNAASLSLYSHFLAALHTSKVRVNPISITEYLFFAIFGQKNTDDFSISERHKLQPKWTIYLFKISFSLYMLVTVIVLINLLIAMMSDTYQSIQSQSDIEWKYGLSKLIRKMQKTRTAPSPLNLFTTWITYLVKTCKKRANKKKKMDVSHRFMRKRGLPKDSISRDDKILPLDRNEDNDGFALLRSRSPFQSQSSLIQASKIENIVDWDIVRKKYRMRFGDEIEKPSGEDEIVDGTI